MLCDSIRDACMRVAAAPRPPILLSPEEIPVPQIPPTLPNDPTCALGVAVDYPFPGVRLPPVAAAQPIAGPPPYPVSQLCPFCPSRTQPVCCHWRVTGLPPPLVAQAHMTSTCDHSRRQNPCPLGLQRSWPAFLHAPTHACAGKCMGERESFDIHVP